MTTYFTSDWHFGHANILNYEPGRTDQFGPVDVDGMNEAMVERWNAQVGRFDRVIFVGDFAMGKIRETAVVGKRLNGRKILIPGNHDRVHSHYGHSFDKRADWINFYMHEADFAEIWPETVTYTFDGIEAMVSHFPYDGDHTDGPGGLRYMEYRAVDQGMALVHGHVHSMWAENGRQFNVGADAHEFRMIPEEEITEFLKGIT